jgi:Outer membrane lipoprotein carrier protein LolA
VLRDTWRVGVAILAVVAASAGSDAGSAGSEQRAVELLDRAHDARGEFRVLRARFEQERTISLVEHVVRSAGAILLGHDGRVVWLIEEPERVRVTVGPEGIFVGGRRVDAGAPGEVGPLAVSRRFADLFTGSSAELRRDFTLSSKGADRARLVPRRAEIGRWLAAIEIAFVEGQHLPWEIVLEEVEGDRTRVRFRSVEVDPEIGAEAFAP